MTLLCLLVSAESGEKADKEPQSREEKAPVEPRKSAKKREKKSKGEEGFQIWSELETQRNKFMVTHLLLHCCLLFNAHEDESSSVAFSLSIILFL